MAREGSAHDSLLPKELGRIRVEPGKWKYIVIHHSASPNASVKGMDYYHRVERHMENGLAYHFVIGNGHSMIIVHRSEEHTSELQSLRHLVCRLLLEKKK